MPDTPYNVLFLCTGNSARSILGEALLNKMGEGRFRAYSAGSQPKGDVHPMTIEVLERFDYPIHDLHSKNWNEFTKPGAPEFDFIFTVCDNAAGESCPVWPGKPLTAHWGGGRFCSSRWRWPAPGIRGRDGVPQKADRAFSHAAT